MRSELYHKTNLASENEVYFNVCLTKHVHLFAIWKLAVNSVNLGKRRLKRTFDKIQIREIVMANLYLYFQFVDSVIVCPGSLQKQRE